jgi:hypothetical protein
LSLLFFQCNKNIEKFDRELELKDYLSNVHGIDLTDDNQLVFMLSNKTCNCTGEPKEIIPNNFSKNNLHKIILIEKRDSVLVNALSKLSNTKIYFDTLSQMAEFGLSNSTDFVFEYKNNEIIYWSYLSSKTDSTIGVRYKK